MSALDIITRDGMLVVSSEQIADGSGVEHRAVLQLIQINRADFEEFGDLAFEMRDRPGVPGPALRVALLNEQQATLLMTFQRNTDQVRGFKKALVKAFFDMARTAAPLSRRDLALAVLAAEDEADRQKARALKAEAKVLEDAPKVEYVETFVAGEDLRIMRNVAKSIGVPEEALRTALIEHHWIYVEETTRWSNSKQAMETMRRYSPYADKRDYFRPVPVHDTPRFKGEVMHTLKVTPQGAVAISRSAERWGLQKKVNELHAKLAEVS